MKIRISVLAMMAAGMLAGCAQTTSGKAGATTPATLGGDDKIDIGAPPPSDPSKVKIPSSKAMQSEANIQNVRKNALTESAQTYGSRMGYARRSWEKMADTQKRAALMSQAFDFNRLAVRAPGGAGIVMPPVISGGTGAFTVSDNGQEAAVADAYLTIVKPGRIVSEIPTWREYLIMPANTPESPVSELLPRNDDEKRFYSAAFQKAWEDGVAQADMEFQERLNRLERDYRGMLQYIRLVNAGMMDEMILSTANFGVTTTEDGEMRVGSRAVKITSEAAFRSNPKRWSVQSVSAAGALVSSMGVMPGIGDQKQ